MQPQQESFVRRVLIAAAVAVASFVAVVLLGMPLAVTLGLLAELLEFVP